MRSADRRFVGHFLTPDSHESVPIAILLMLCDEPAVWQRPKFALPARLTSDTCVRFDLDLKKTLSGMTVSLDSAALNVVLHADGQEYARSCRDALDRRLQSTEGHPAFDGHFFGRSIAHVSL